MQPLTITAADGYKLSALFGKPWKPSAGTIVISSATGIKKEFYINFSAFLTDIGYNVLLFDYRGIGGSAPYDLKTLQSYMYEWGTQDMNAVINYLAGEGLTDIIWVGHSVGGQLIGFLENKQHLRKVIAINAAFGYWRFFPSPMKWMVWCLWYFVAPVLTKVYGYTPMQKVGWGENLPKNMAYEWREWCLSKSYFTSSLNRQLQADKFYKFTTPITALYLSDDLIANDKTVSLMMKFFPNSPQKIIKLSVMEHTRDRVGHNGIFRKKFENSLWPVLLEVIKN